MFIWSALVTLIITGIAGYLGKLKVNTSKDFITGGNKLGVLGVTSMLMGSIIGGASTVGTAQMAYNRGIGAIWFILGLSISSIFLGLMYAKQVEQENHETIPHILGQTYGKKARTAASLLLSGGIFIHINGQVIAVIALFTAIFGLSTFLSAVIVIGLLVVYVIFGGFWGGTLVGSVKTVLLYSTSLISGYILFFHLKGGSEILAYFPKEPWFNLFSSGIANDLASGIATVVGVLSTQTYFQAVIAGRNSKVSRNSAFLTAFLVFPIGIVCTSIGMYMRIHYPNIVPSEAFPLFLQNHLHPVIGGISIATILISSIATGAGLALGMATMFVRDVYKEIIHPQAGDKLQLYLLRLSIVVIGFMTFGIVMKNQDSMVLDWGFLSMIFRATPIFLPLTAAMFFKNRLKAESGIYAIIGGPAASILWILLGYGKITSLYIGLGAGFIILAGMNLRYGELGKQR
ncbi:sodium:solute symporter family protein [Geosporobacter ferrireducens]|uniref:Sodium:solute symporter n=1 Tax=Geosporobacter ferrireducens TaxID=1424294 RepID=A0A1D8GKM1_9FIRM|nr:sodium:solute symporter family protein [Geosporobacter ferrireducens]AOT71422.1 sodium:solute symporter [Geosporobacter ferrireducens]MTI57726.1 sodium:solute symporter family protein [Geosporobacter ferrireducens]